MDLGLKDKVAVVTGGSSGIGLATARLLLLVHSLGRRGPPCSPALTLA